MKSRLILGVLIIASSVMFVSCNGVKRDAVRQMKVTLAEMAGNSESFKVSKVKAQVANDSLVVINCLAQEQGKTADQVEYIVVRSPRTGGYLEVVNRGEYTPLLNSAQDFYESGKEMFDKTRTLTGKSVKEYVLDLAYATAWIQAGRNGREIELGK